jgi:RNA polymerase-binding transcription factor DksA
MDIIQLRKCQEKLLKRRRQILSTAEHLEKEKEQFAGQREVEWLDQAWDENELRLLDRLSETYLREMGRIEMALERISAGTYGFCFACHRLIEKERLDIFPEVEFCLGCQDMREQFERV